MILYFLRHGHAEPGGMIDDFDRELTTEGVLRLRVAAKVMHSLEMNVTRVLTSPRVRARQTADIAAEAFDLTAEVREELNFSFDVAKLAKLTAEFTPQDNLMLVGHEPTFSSVVRRMTGADIAMKKGGLVRVDLYDMASMRGTLVWLIAPRVFDTLDER
ncbi:MAG: phosphohistidine phosphatase SixA [Chloroflexota bacterium]